REERAGEIHEIPAEQAWQPRPVAAAEQAGEREVAIAVDEPPARGARGGRARVTGARRGHPPGAKAHRPQAPGEVDVLVIRAEVGVEEPAGRERRAVERAPAIESRGRR